MTERATPRPGSDGAARMGRAAGRRAGAGRSAHLRDFVYGAIDGAVTTFAIVAGVQGAGLPHGIILALGTANVLADGFSMAASNYSGTKAERDDMMRLRAMTTRRIETEPEGERENICRILRAKGLDGALLEEAVDVISNNKTAWIDLLLGEEETKPQAAAPIRAALATFAAFLAAGLIPLLPYALGLEPAFRLSIAATGLVFFTIGALKSRWSLNAWWRSGLETLAIGAAAASIAYWVGTLFRMA